MPLDTSSPISPDMKPQPKSMAELGLPKPLEEAPQTVDIELTSPVEAVPEVKVETVTESKPEASPVEKQVEQVKPALEQKIETTVSSSSTVVTQTKDELSRQIEDILSENVAEDYKKMPPALQQKFRAEGEITARKIKVMLESGKVKFKKIVDLLLSWLKIIPGLNKYFLHQEAKIKADKIVHLREGSILDDK